MTRHRKRRRLDERMLKSKRQRAREHRRRAAMVMAALHRYWLPLNECPECLDFRLALPGEISEGESFAGEPMR